MIPKKWRLQFKVPWNMASLFIRIGEGAWGLVFVIQVWFKLNCNVWVQILVDRVLVDCNFLIWSWCFSYLNESWTWESWMMSCAGGKCRNDPSDQYLKVDCWAHSSVMNLANNAIRALMILTDTQCSAGQFIADGTLKQIGGNNNGIRRVR